MQWSRAMRTLGLLRERTSASARCTNAIRPALPHLKAQLFYKGFHAIHAYRLASALLREGRRALALDLRGRMALIFGIDINPSAQIGRGIMIDHGTGVVIGETAVVGDGVSMLQGVTLGGTGKDIGDRHPKVREGVMI